MKRRGARAPLLALLLALGGALAAPAARALDVYTIDFNSSKSSFNRHHIEHLLTAALQATAPRYGAWQLRTSPIRMERDRLLQEMRKGKLVNLSAQVTSAEWEQALLAIRIPVDKGIAGYRIALIDGRRQPQFDAVQSLAQLRAMPMGAGRQWSSAQVFRDAGFDVVPGNSADGLHSMLAAGRFWYFPRAIDEAVFELEAHRAAFPALALEQSLVVYFPLPRYFFVAPDQPRLARRLREGLAQLVADGSYDRIFHEYYDELIDKAGLRQRRLFKIANPQLSPQTPLDKPQYWYDPYARK
jgi:hypothetical protein